MIKPITAVILLIASTQVHALCPVNANSSDFPNSEVTSLENAGIQSAWYDGATDRYGHGVLGDAIEASILSINTADSCEVSITLDTDHVFEDINPRLANIDNKPGAEVITVRSHRNKGAQIAVYALAADNTLKLLTTTPYIGTANRWLAPVGIADFDNDGNIDIAFVDRPHLAKTLRVWSYKNSELIQVASQPGFSNHRIGEVFISGGIRQCGTEVEMITADARWQRVLATRLINGELVSEDIGPFESTESLTAAIQCP